MKKKLIYSALLIFSIFLQPYLGFVLAAFSAFQLRAGVLVLCVGIYFDILYGTSTGSIVSQFVYTVIGGVLYVGIELIEKRVRK